MKLLTKLFLITDAKGKDINIKGKPIVVALNGEKTITKLEDIFSHPEYDMGEIYGNSLLSLYQVQEDGSLQVEGSKIQLINFDTDELILVKKIDKPWVKADTDIPFEDVQKFSEYFKIAKPEEVFSSLTAEEKQSFISAREAKAQENEVAAKAAANQAETEAATTKAAADLLLKEQKEKEETEYKATLDPQYVLDQNAYESLRTYYKGLEGFKHYINGLYEFFYGDDPSYPIGLAIKRGDAWWEEINDEDLTIIEKNDKEVIIEFPDKGVPTRLILNREAGDIEINVPKATE